MSVSLHANTPSVTVCDARAAPVRVIACYRHPAAPTVMALRITRHRYGPRGDCTHSADSRLGETGMSNFRYEMALGGSPLRTHGVDDGTQLALQDATGRPLLAVGNIAEGTGGTQDMSQAVTRTWQYEDRRLAGRLVSITERTADSEPRVVERFVHAGNTAANQALNLVGQCIHHYDPVGSVQTHAVALTGVASAVTRHLSADLDTPARLPHWPDADPSACNDLLDEERFTTTTTADATGAVLTNTDAKGNRQRLAYDVAGGISGVWLTLLGSPERAIVTTLVHSAAGQKLHETHGNGVVSTYTYDPRTQRLVAMQIARPAGHAHGASVLQDLYYTYDPVGNVVTVTDTAQPTRFWRNQRVSAENIYVYDSLYQLVSASGREMANAGQPGAGLPPVSVPLPVDASAYTNYIRTYRYDTAGNLTQIHHSAPAVNRSYTIELTVSNRSNRAVSSALTEDPSAVDALFTAGGQQRLLQPGQVLSWTPRNELAQVTPIVRDAGADDVECYHYDAATQRVLKLSVQTTGSTVHTQRTLYLPGLELRTQHTAATLTRDIQVIDAGEAGHAQVRVLRWQHGKPNGLPGDSIRYSYDTLTGSSGLELDDEGQVISLEEYYPYGGTAVWTARSQVEASDKTRRYSGKERDATGLYYYGYRYYQAWVGRWLSADPAGWVDGLNLYRMCRNNPITYVDDDGLEPTDRDRAGLIIKKWMVENIRRKWADDSFGHMHRYGRAFGGSPEARNNPVHAPNPSLRPEELAQENLDTYLELPYSKEQSKFINRFMKNDLYLVHATDRNLENAKGDINLYSRKQLQDKRVGFAEANTTSKDLEWMATDDFVFFSIEVGRKPKKPSSRFGDRTYRIPASHPAFKFASLGLVDPLVKKFPTPKVPGLSEGGMRELQQKRAFPGPTNGFFFGMERLKFGIAGAIAASAGVLTNPDDKALILGARTSEELDAAMNSLYRPEVRVPRMVAIKQGDYKKHKINRQLKI